MREPPHHSPSGVDVVDSVCFAAGAAVLAVAGRHAAAEGWPLVTTLGHLLCAVTLLASASLSAERARQRWPWIPIGIAAAALLAAVPPVAARILD